MKMRSTIRSATGLVARYMFARPFYLPLAPRIPQGILQNCALASTNTWMTAWNTFSSNNENNVDVPVPAPPPSTPHPHSTPPPSLPPPPPPPPPPLDWSAWKASMVAKNAADLELQLANLRNEIQDKLPHEFHPTLFKINDYYMLSDLSYVYVMYGSRRPNVEPQHRIAVRHMTMKHIEKMESDPSKKEFILLMLWVMRDFGCL